MPGSQNELNFSPYAELYDKIIPKGNLLRRINENTGCYIILMLRNAGTVHLKRYAIKGRHKIYSVVIKSGDFRVKAKERYRIEAKNSGLRNVHGCDVAAGSGLADMKMQDTCTIFVVNLKRIFTLMDEKQ
jgi:hypothetical protein